MKHINEKEFYELINEELVLIDFYADWCGPCKMLGPQLEELNKENIVSIYKVNVDENQSLAKNLGVMSIPTLMIYKKGRQIASKLGFMPKEEIKKWILENK